MRSAHIGISIGGALFLGLVAVGCNHTQESEEGAASVSQRVVTSYALTTKVPAGTTTADFPILAQDAIWLRDRAKVLVETGSTHGSIANLGQRTTEVGATAEVANVLSRANVFLRQGAHVFGYLKTQGKVDRQNATVVDGGIEELASIPTETNTRTVTFPTASGDVTVFQNQSQTLSPGAYGRVSVYSGGTLRLSAGEYYFNTLQIEPQAHVRINNSAGSVFLYVRSELKYASAFENAGGVIGNTLLAYFGTPDASLQAALRGTFMAPNAQVTLTTLNQGEHIGAVFAKSVDLAAGCTLRHVPFGLRVEKKWSAAVPTGTRFADMAVASDGLVLGVTESLKVLSVSTNGTTVELSAGGPQPRHVTLHPQALTFGELSNGTMSLRSSSGSLLGQFTIGGGSHVVPIPNSQRLVVSDVVDAGSNAKRVQQLRVVEPGGATVSTIAAPGLRLMRTAQQHVLFLAQSNLVRSTLAGSTDWQMPVELETFEVSNAADRVIAQRLSSRVVVHYSGQSVVSENTLDAPIWKLAMSPSGVWSAAGTANGVRIFKNGIVNAQATLTTRYLTSLNVNDMGEVLLGSQTSDNQGRMFMISAAGYTLWQGSTGVQDSQAYRPEITPASTTRFYVRQMNAISAYDVVRAP